MLVPDSQGSDAVIPLPRVLRRCNALYSSDERVRVEDAVEEVIERGASKKKKKQGGKHNSRCIGDLALFRGGPPLYAFILQ